MPPAAKTENAERAGLLMRNLRSLLDRERLSQRRVADELDVSYKWVRRLCHQGLARPDKRSAAYLQRLAEYFDVSPKDLWSPELLQPSEIPKHHVLIKWYGSKRKQSAEIVSHFPSAIETYYEPFLGGGSVLLRLIESDIKVERFRCSDLCKPLIDIWNLVIRDPRALSSRYDELWHGLKEGGTDFYEKVRRRFNENGDSADLYFLSRTCRIGHLRFNRSGHFMVSHHPGQAGAPPKTVKKLITVWSKKLRDKDVQFAVRDFREIRSKSGDFLYCDPPYRLKDLRLYLGTFDHTQLFDWLSKQQGGFALSLSGFIGEEDRRMDVPKSLYQKEFLIDNGSSAVGRISGGQTPWLNDALYVREN